MWDELWHKAIDTSNTYFTENEFKNIFLIFARNIRTHKNSTIVTNDINDLDQKEKIANFNNNILHVINKLAEFHNSIKNKNKYSWLNNLSSIIWNEATNTNEEQFINENRIRVHNYLNSKFWCWTDCLEMMIPNSNVWDSSKIVILICFCCVMMLLKDSVREWKLNLDWFPYWKN